ncbi:MAG TPA: hypothetical protein VGO11_00410 [Chthoniobacteraceae bacterium]|nr:hypothetical protein [Chthoniobacteraceae bacterium]
MSFTATVENDVIKLPESTHLPNGATVRVEVIEKKDAHSGAPPPPSLGLADPRISPEVRERLRKISGRATTGLSTDEILRESRCYE